MEQQQTQKQKPRHLPHLRQRSEAHCSDFAIDHHSSLLFNHPPFHFCSPLFKPSTMPKRRKQSEDGNANNTNTPSLPSIAGAAASILAGDADDSGAGAAASHSNSKRKANLISNNNGSTNTYGTNNGNTTPTINSDGGGDPDDPTGKSTNAIPIFLKKTYRMIDTCDPEICSWTADGEMFVVKNPVSYLHCIIALLHPLVLIL